MRRRPDLKASWIVALTCTSACSPAVSPPPERADVVVTAAPPIDPPPAVDISHVTAAWNRSCVLRDKNLWCWGIMASGAAGVPQRFDDLGELVSVALGDIHSCAARVDGSVRCWGSGKVVGNLYGATAPGFEPIPLPPGVRQVVVNRVAACARDDAGAVHCWGGNIGVAPQTIELPGAAEQLAAGSRSACALVAGDVWCWRDDDVTPVRLGDARYRDLALSAEGGLCAVTRAGSAGDGEVHCFGEPCTGRQTPWAKSRCEHVIAGARSVVAEGHWCVRGDDGWHCWGNNDMGQIAADGAAWLAQPRRLASAVATARELAPGRQHSCAIIGDDVHCWGSDNFGALGRGEPPWLGRRYRLKQEIASVAEAAILETGVCVLDGDTPRCWGGIRFGDQRRGSAGGAGELVTEAKGALALSASDAHLCARRETDVVCWDVSRSPTASDRQFDEVVAGGGFACGLKGGSLTCWTHDGANPTLSEDSELITGVARLSAGTDHACWARGREVTCPRLLSRSIELPEAPTQLASGGDFACALVSEGIYCWGQGAAGELGDGRMLTSELPVRAELDGAVAVAAGRNHACAVDSEGGVWCWGANQRGQLGIADRLDRDRPVRVLGVPPAAAVLAGPSLSCSLGRDRAVTCWGSNATAVFDDAYAWGVAEPPRPVVWEAAAELAIDPVQLP